VDLLVVSVGTIGRFDGPGKLTRSGAKAVELAAVTADSAAIDGLLDRRGGRRLVIDADLAGLNLVLSRLMRRGELGTAETAVLPREPVPFLAWVGVPSDRTGQLDVAVHGEPQLVGVIKDDSGGLCADGATVAPWTASSQGRQSLRSSLASSLDAHSQWWLRAVVDDQRLCDGTARSLAVRRRGPSELEASVRTGRFKTTSYRGRSLQLACDEALIISDGVPRERPRSKRTFWSEPTLWQLALP
jgi:hypothetical protein